MSDNGDSEPGEEGDSLEKRLAAYRQSLIAAEQTMQSEYDKGVLTLSGGALGISLVYLKDVVGTKPLHNAGFLLGAWVVWGLSISLILASYFTSTKALRRAVTETDAKTIYMTLAQSGWATATKVFNALGGVCFFFGVVLLVYFASCNLPK
jgi:hypothetical protein